MEAIPERFIYIPLPRLPHTGLPHLQRPNIKPLIAAIAARLPSWRVARTTTIRWWGGHGQQALTYAVVLAASVGVGFLVARL
jgi:hypothetical protein